MSFVVDYAYSMEIVCAHYSRAYTFLSEFVTGVYYVGVYNKPIRHVVCAGALGRVKTDT